MSSTGLIARELMLIPARSRPAFASAHRDSSCAVSSPHRTHSAAKRSRTWKIYRRMSTAAKLADIARARSSTGERETSRARAADRPQQSPRHDGPLPAARSRPVRRVESETDGLSGRPETTRPTRSAPWRTPTSDRARQVRAGRTRPVGRGESLDVAEILEITVPPARFGRVARDNATAGRKTPHANEIFSRDLPR